MKTYMFPGQGSQSKGMGSGLFDEFKDLTDKADKILGYSIKELCIEDPNRELNKTQFTQPALYVVNALSYYKKIADEGGKPDYVIGHSLGEFNALLAAECFDFEAGLKLVKKRGELMSQAKDGGMAAVLNASKKEVENILAENNFSQIDLANFNTLTQIVISGDKEEINNAQSVFQTGNILYYALNTSGAFHSRFMQDSKEKFERYIKKFKLSELTIPVISNVTALPYENNNILQNLSDQISSPVLWCDSVQHLIKLDADMEFVEIGHGEVLTKLVDKIKRELKTVDVSGDNAVEEKSNGKAAIANTAEARSFNAAKFNSTEEKVVAWNKTFPVGSKVKSTILKDYGELETRTEAMVLFGHRAAVYMKGYNGYFDLDELTPA